MTSCRSLLESKSVFSSGLLSAHALFDLITTLLNFAANFGLLYWIYVQRRNVSRGNSKVLKSIIFPMYLRILLLLGCVNILIALLNIFYVEYPKYHHTDTESTPLHVKIVYSATFAAQHFILEGIALMLLQRGCGVYAAKVAGKYSAIWTVLSFLSFYSSFSKNSVIANWGFYSWNIAIVLFYVVIWLAPSSWFYRRPASSKYASYWCVFRILYAGCMLLADHGERIGWMGVREVGYCGDLVLGFAIFPLLLPLLVYWTLLQDSR